ncbi:hypothetical protein ABIB68_004572 [Bradyrhizobium sp. F1.2.2]|jgi:hypothetical protein
MSRCAQASATMAAQDVRMNAGGIGFHQMIESRSLARDQELGRGVVEPLALQLPDRRAQFENLGAQLENPVRIRVFLHRALPKLSAARDHAQRTT